MHGIDLDELTLDELRALQKDVDKAILSHTARMRREARAAAEKIAKDAGFTLEELATPNAKTGSKFKAPPKYRHPENPEVTWSGRGRRPGWFLGAIEAGASEEDLLIK